MSNTMSSGSRVRLGLRLTGVLLTSAGLATAAASVAQASPLDEPDFSRWCGNSASVEQITVEEWSGARFKIIITPTSASRRDIDARQETVLMFHAVQACVPGLYGSLADSVWDQLLCHQQLALLPTKTLDGYASGETYDLESWRPTGAAAINHCGNELNKQSNPSPNESYRVFRPDGRDPGYLDIQPLDNIA